MLIVITQDMILQDEVSEKAASVRQSIPCQLYSDPSFPQGILRKSAHPEQSRPYLQPVMVAHADWMLASYDMD